MKANDAICTGCVEYHAYLHDERTPYNCWGCGLLKTTLYSGESVIDRRCVRYFEYAVAEGVLRADG